MTWVESESDDPGGLLAAIGAGRVAISAGRDGPVLVRAEDELIAVGADGTVLAGLDGRAAAARAGAGPVPGRAGPPPAAE